MHIIYNKGKRKKKLGVVAFWREYRKERKRESLRVRESVTVRDSVRVSWQEARTKMFRSRAINYLFYLKEGEKIWSTGTTLCNVYKYILTHWA